MKFLKVRTLAFGFVTKLLSKLFFVEMLPFVSVMVFIKKEEKYLFVKLTYLNGLGVPGGIIKGGETVLEALSREIYEETGLKVVRHNYLGSISSSFKGLSTLSLVFDVESSGEERGSREGELVWLKLEDAKEKLAYKSAKDAVERFKL